MADGFEFLKKFWEQAAQSTSGKTGTTPHNLFGSGFGQGLSNWAMPTLSVEELDKKISDLKSVEQWLTVNLNLLHSTIQALEVQRATLINIQNFAEKVGGNVSDFFTHANAASEAVSESVKQMSESPMGSWADNLGNTSHPAAAEATQAEEATAYPPEAPDAEVEEAADATDAEENTADQANEAPVKDWAANLADATVWWNQLQDQFQQVAKAALAASASAAAEATSAATPDTTDQTAPKKASKASTANSTSKTPKAAAKKPATKTAKPKSTTASKTAAPAKKKSTTKAASTSSQHRTELASAPRPARPAFTVARALREKKSP